MTSPHPHTATCRSGQGFTLIELMVTIALFAILLMLAVPSFTTWIRNSQIRSTAESLQNGLRAAKTQAASLNRQVVFSTTNLDPGLDATATVGGRNWSAQIVPLTAGENTGRPIFLQGGAFAGGLTDVTITGGPIGATLCFSSSGRIVANNAPSATLPACTIPVSPALSYTYTIARTTAVTGQDRTLAVQVSLNGQIRMCDPARTLTTSPDGC